MRIVQLLRRLTVACLLLAGSLVHAQAPPGTAPYKGPRKSLAVEQVLATDSTGGALTADGMTALLTAALVRDGRFVVVERAGLATVQAEQGLGQGGAAQAETAARSGQLIGASAIVRAAITKYQPNASGGSVTLGGMSMGGLAALLKGGMEAKNQTAMIEIGVRLIDTTTGQVVSTSAAQGTASGSSAGASAANPLTGLGAGVVAFRNSPIGQAGEQAIAKAVEQIASGMRDVAWSASVVDATEVSSVYVSAGTDRGMQPGMRLGLYRKSRVLTDPGTGVVLDVELLKLGTALVKSVRERVSIASFEGTEPPVRGDIVRLD